jgi:hypothetical protein
MMLAMMQDRSVGGKTDLAHDFGGVFAEARRGAL